MIFRRLIISFTAFFLFMMPVLSFFEWNQAFAQAPEESDEPVVEQTETATSIRFLTGPTEGSAQEIALAYLNEKRDVLGLSQADLDGLLLTDEYVTRHNQITHLYFQQRLNGIEVVGAHLNMNITVFGEIATLNNHFIRCVTLEQCLPTLTEESTLTAVEAVESAAVQLGLKIPESLISRGVDEGDEPNQAVLLNDGEISLDPIPAKLVYLPLKKEGLRLAWEIVLRLENGQNWWQLQIDALTGEILQQQDWINHGDLPHLSQSNGYLSFTQAVTDNSTSSPTTTTTSRDATLTPTATITSDDSSLTLTATITSRNGTLTPTATIANALTLTDGLTQTDDSIISDPSLWPSDRISPSISTQSMTITREVDAPPSTYRVLPLPYSHPEDNSARFELITESIIGIGSPFGWHDIDGDREADFTDTRGNNVFAQEDANANDEGGARADGKATLTFDFEFDPDLKPTEGENLEAALVNLFYISNVLHDILYLYGFDEVSGNFQQMNYDGEGLDEDPLQADVLDGAGEVHANFGTPPDGQSPRMQMFASSVANRDSSFENQVIIHEYAHGVAERLTGGPSSVSCLDHNEQMSEGWSDWLALALTAKEGDSGTQIRDLFSFGSPKDLRAYSTNIMDNPVTYGQLDELLMPYGVGHAWGSMLWELHWELVEKHGFDPDWYAGQGGNQLALQLILDGMKLQPCHPSFTDARDAILLADQVNNKGDNQCQIWSAFAKRGLGLSANAGSPYSLVDGQEAFDMPSECDLLNVEPVKQAICIGQEASYEVILGEAYPAPVRLTVNANLASSSALFRPNPVGGVPGTSTLLVSTTNQTTIGTYELTIIGSGGKEVGNKTVQLDIFERPPGTVVLNQPLENAIDTRLNPVFEWTGVANASKYILEVDDDPNFETIDYTTTVSDGTSHTAKNGLSTLRTYYWRVRSENPCGVGETSAPSSFTTGELICSAPNIGFTDYNLVSDEIKIDDDRLITDLNVQITSNHSNVRDQLFTLSHLESGTSVTLVNRPACQGGNMSISLDDEVPSSVDSTCQTNRSAEEGEMLAMTGVLQPSMPLSAFDFKPLAGTWRLSASDNANEDVGILQEWCLSPSTAEAIGTLTGKVADVESNVEIEGAVITAQNDLIRHTTESDKSGRYSMTLGIGKYDLMIAATNYLSNTISDFSINSDTLSTTQNIQDVVLQGSSLFYDETPIEKSLQIGEIVTHTLMLNNRGPFPLTYVIDTIESEESCTITNGDFETGNLTGWNIADEREGWSINHSHHFQQAHRALSPPLRGKISALIDQNQAGTSILYQDITLPDPLPQEVIISWLDEWHNHATLFTDDQQFRVELYGPDGVSFLGELLRTKDNSPLISPITRREVDITQWVSDYAGETVRLAFIEEDTLSFLNVQIDNVQCQKAATWVNVPETNMIPPHSRSQLDVIIDTSSFYQTDNYAAELLFSGNFVNDVPPISLTLDLDCKTCAKLTGVVRDIDTKEPLPATIQITSVQVNESLSDTTQSPLDITLFGEEYEVLVPSGPHEIAITAEGYSDGQRNIVAEGSKTIVTDFELVSENAILDITSPVISEDLLVGDVVIIPITVKNSGLVKLELNSQIKNIQMPEETSGSRESIPDEFGYTVIDSKNVNGPRYDFIDLSENEEIEEQQAIKAENEDENSPQSTATVGNVSPTPESDDEEPENIVENESDLITGSVNEDGLGTIQLDDDQTVGPFPIGFEFDFYGTLQNEFYISSNGFISFENVDPTLTNQCRLPDATSPNNLIALMWDDLDPRDSRDKVYYQTFNACPVGKGPCLVVQYEQMHHFPGGGDSAGSFEAILFKNGDILMQYEDVGSEAGANATTGIENSAGSAGLTYNICNSEYLTDNLAVCFTHPDGNDCGRHDWVKMNPNRLTLGASQSTTVDVILDAKSLSQVGDYRADVSFVGNFANDPGRIPVSMTLTCPECDTLSGMISDAETGRPIVAELLISGPGGFNTRIIGNQYDLPLLRGTYDMTAKAAGYIEKNIDITFREGFSNTVDFLLEPNDIQLTLTPFLSESVELGSVISNTITLSNSSPFDVEFKILTPYVNALEANRSTGGPFTLSATRNKFLPNEDAPASGLAPLKSNVAYQKTNTQKTGLSNGVLAYGLEALTNKFIYFESDKQDKLTYKRSTGMAQIWGADFVTGDFTTLYGLTENNELIALDIATSKTTTLYEVVPPKTHEWSAMAHDPFRNVMYAASTNCKQSFLFIINIASGVLTPIGRISNAPCVTALAANSVGRLYALDVSRDNFLQLDVFTGQGEIVGELGFDANFSQGMDFDQENNRLYLAAYNNQFNEAQLRIIDPTTGSSSFIGAFGAPNTVQLNTIAIPSGMIKEPSWAVMSPEQGRILANESIPLNLLFNGRSLYERGNYNTTLSLMANSEPNTANIDLEMDLYCGTCSVLNGSITDAESGNPLTTKLNVTDKTGFSTELIGDKYQLTIQPGSYKFVVEANGYLSQTAVISTTQATTVTTNFTLIPAVSKIETTPSVIYKEMQMNQSVSNTLIIENKGVVDLDFSTKISNYRSPQRQASNQTSLDEFGYTIIDSNEPGGTRYEFIDIQERTGESGRQVTLTDDEAVGPFPIGFDFEFYGTSQSEFYLSSNGLISFGTAIEDYNNPCSLHTEANSDITEESTPNNLIALMWDDLDPADTDDVIYYETFDACPIGEGPCLIVQYDKYHHFPGRSDNVAGTFEAILFKKGDVLLQYANVGNEEGKNATIGLRNSDGTVALTYNSCQAEESDEPMLGRLSDKLAICFAHPEGNTCGDTAGTWIAARADKNKLEPDERTNLNIGFNSNDLYQRGNYHAQMTLSGNFVNEPNPLPITMPVSCPTCGYLQGQVTDAETGHPLYARLEISGSNGIDLEFSGERYSIALPPETYNFSAYAKGYLSQTLTVSPNLGMTTTTDFALTPAVAKLGIKEAAISKVLQLSNTITHTITISNSGVVDLDFETLINEQGAPLNRLKMEDLRRVQSVERSTDKYTNTAAKTLLFPTELGQGNLLFEMNAGSKTRSKLLLGVEYVNGSYFITAGGARNPDEPNLLYQLDSNGTLLSTWVQPTGSKWGWHDLAFDGTYLYASDSEVIQQIDPQTGQPTGVTIPSPETPARALAYDPERDTFWVANYDSPLYEIDRDGEIVNQFINSLTISGLAWDQWSESSAPLWSWSQDGSNGHLAAQINPADGRLTGRAFEASRIRNNAGVAGGATIGLINDRLTFVGLEQLSYDLIARYDLASQVTPLSWVKTVPQQGTLAADESAQIQVIFDTKNFFQTGDYNAELHLLGNFTNQVESIPLGMQVFCPRCTSLNGSVSAAHTGNPLQATIRITNDKNMDFSIKDDNYALSVPPGTYNVAVSASGYMSQTRTINLTRDAAAPTNFILTPLIDEQKADANVIKLIEEATIGEPISRTLTLTDSTAIAFNLDLSTLFADLPTCASLKPEELTTTTPITPTLTVNALLNLDLNLQEIALTESGLTAELNFSARQSEERFCIQESEQQEESETSESEATEEGQEDEAALEEQESEAEEEATEEGAAESEDE